jgi:carbamoyl-phosphate synthase small subunit
MTGYQEVLTDPSYRGQIACMTYPLIGNYGVNAGDAESRGLHPRGFVVKEVSPIASSRMAERDLAGYLAEHGVVGLHGIDTRALTRHVRSRGALRGVLAGGSAAESTPEQLAARARALPFLRDEDLVGEVTTKERYAWTEPVAEEWVDTGLLPPVASLRAGAGLHVVTYDFGVKRGILRGLARTGCRVTVVPARTAARDVLSLRPDGIFLSNGPGDPAVLGGIVEQVKALVDKAPIFGICLGHQVVAQVFGAKTYKLKFGHRGANHPVKDLTTGKVEITTQNHGYAVDADTLSEDVTATHVNLNDMTLEGLAHRQLPVFSVQYHPEASPGPHDAYYLFKRFVELMRSGRPATA